MTNLDLHEISRASKTYWVKSFYVVTPLKDQSEVVKRIISHWTHGAGGTYNPKRRQALELIRIKESLEGAIDKIRAGSAAEETPKTVVTSARNSRHSIGFSKLRQLLQSGKPYLLVFGTAWGLSDDLISGADYTLEPVRGVTDYNHLSVRSAAAIILDRLLGK